MIPNVRHLRSGVEIIVDDQDSDSLAVLRVQRRHGVLQVEVGLRGNADVRDRPIERTFVRMRAPDVEPEERRRRIRRWKRENAWRLR